MIDFEIAKTWHRFFARHLELIAEGVIDQHPTVLAVFDDHACQLGRWLHGPAHELHALPGYRDLVRVHADFHRQACALVESLTRGEGAKADALAQFTIDSAAVTQSIDQLMQEFEEDAATRGSAPYKTVFASYDVDTDGWSDSLLIGIPPIDDQHRAIVRLLSRLGRIKESPLMSESAVDVLSELGKVLRLHFATEEAILKRCGMPVAAVDEHLRQHDDMLEQYAEMNLQALGHDLERVGEIIDPISLWAFDHVVQYDFQLRRYAA